jgi:hypothetical protein
MSLIHTISNTPNREQPHTVKEIEVRRNGFISTEETHINGLLEGTLVSIQI